MNNSERINIIQQRLQQALKPTELVVKDESHKHVGHPGAKDGRGHFAISISSDQFKGLSRIECHRLIYAALDELMQTDIHALRIRVI